MMTYLSGLTSCDDNLPKIAEYVSVFILNKFLYFIGHML